MGKSLGISLAKRDDPIFKEGPTFYTRQSDRGSTPPTPSAPQKPEKPTGREPRKPKTRKSEK